MNILIYVKTTQNLKKKENLGGIEILNYNLYKFLKKKNYVILTNKIFTNLKRKNWDLIISSNNAEILIILLKEIFCGSIINYKLKKHLEKSNYFQYYLTK